MWDSWGWARRWKAAGDEWHNASPNPAPILTLLWLLISRKWCHACSKVARKLVVLYYRHTEGDLYESGREVNPTREEGHQRLRDTGGERDQMQVQAQYFSTSRSFCLCLYGLLKWKWTQWPDQSHGFHESCCRFFSIWLVIGNFDHKMV